MEAASLDRRSGLAQSQRDLRAGAGYPHKKAPESSREALVRGFGEGQG